MKLGIEYYELKLYPVHINDDPGLTLTYFTPMSNLAKLFCTNLSGERLQDHWSSGYFLSKYLSRVH